jgi:hypothetical protein
MCGSMSVFGLPCIVKARHSVAGPFPPSPSRACQGLPWRGATLIALCRAGSPIHGSGVEAAPCFGGATRLGWGRIGERGKKEKWKKGPEKKTRFLADGHACFRLLGSLRVPPLAIGVPPTHAEHTLHGGHPSCSACTLGPEGYMLPEGPETRRRLSHAHMCGLERPNPRESYRIHKTRKKGTHSPRPPFISDVWCFN